MPASRQASCRPTPSRALLAAPAQRSEMQVQERVHRGGVDVEPHHDSLSLIRTLHCAHSRIAAGGMMGLVGLMREVLTVGLVQ